MDSSRIAENEKKYVIHSWMAQKDFKPFIVTGGKGAVIWDETGKKYLDFSSQLFNVNIGHQHPKGGSRHQGTGGQTLLCRSGAANDTRGSCAGCWRRSPPAIW